MVPKVCKLFEPIVFWCHLLMTYFNSCINEYQTNSKIIQNVKELETCKDNSLYKCSKSVSTFAHNNGVLMVLGVKGILQARVSVWLSEMSKSPSGKRKEWPKHSLWSCQKKKKKKSHGDTFKGSVYPLRFPAGCLGLVHCILTSCKEKSNMWCHSFSRRRNLKHSCPRKDPSFHTACSHQNMHFFFFFFARGRFKTQ